MLKAVIFDMDGVIIDSHPTHREAWRTFLQTVGKPVSDPELDFVLDGRKRGEILRHYLGELSEEEVRQYGDRKDEFFRERSLQIKLIPGAIELLAQLRNAGIATAVATSASGSRARHVLDQLQLADRFDAVVTGNDVACGKPDPSIYALACRRLNMAPERSLAVEDAVSGIQAARAAGLTCVGVAGERLRDKLWEAGAAHVVENLVDLSLAKLEALLPNNHHRGSHPARIQPACNDFPPGT
jgi:beta-phosphoglucomutase